MVYSWKTFIHRFRTYKLVGMVSIVEYRDFGKSFKFLASLNDDNEGWEIERKEGG